MGLFEFAKEAGEKIFKRHEAPDAEAVTTRLKEVGVDGLDVSVEGDKVVLSGSAASQAERERAILAAGNNQGVAQVDDRIELAKPEPESTYYRVVSGDTLGKIAKQQYGDASKYPVIFEANKPMLKDPDRIYPGQVLRIPALEEK